MFLLCAFLALCGFGFLVGVMNRRPSRLPLKAVIKGHHVYGGQSKDIEVITFGHVMMLDWDVPDVGHASEECLTIRHRGEAVGILEEFCEKEKGYRFRVYETPGGVRAFLTSRCAIEGPKALEDLMGRLKCDPLFTRFCAQRGEWACRVSPKPGREGDYVARYWCAVGEGKEDEAAVALVRYHDEVITKAWGVCQRGQTR